MKRTPCHRFFFLHKKWNECTPDTWLFNCFCESNFCLQNPHCLHDWQAPHLILYTFSFTTMCFGFLVLLDFGFGGVSSGLLDSTKLSTAPDGDSWGGGVPMDLMCLRGTGDSHGNSGLYTKSLSDSSRSVNVGSCLKHLPTLDFVSRNGPPPRYTKTIRHSSMDVSHPVNQTVSLVMTAMYFWQNLETR